MTRSELDAFLAARGFAVDGAYCPHAGGNKFSDLYIGTSRSLADLYPLAGNLREAGLEASVTTIDNPEHPQHGENLVEIKSFWDE